MNNRSESHPGETPEQPECDAKSGQATEIATQPASRFKLQNALHAKGFLELGTIGLQTGDPFFDMGHRSLILVGSTGPMLWPVFHQSPEFNSGHTDPMDRYTQRCLSEIGARFELNVCFPFSGPPYYPFQQWGLRLASFSQSPLGVLVHAEYGPWAAFRCAFLSAMPASSSQGETGSGPCLTCTDKPCLAACPAGALSQEAGYDVPRCIDHMTADDQTACWAGCQARLACPFGKDHHQAADNARFHMESFVSMLAG